MTKAGPAYKRAEKGSVAANGQLSLFQIRLHDCMFAAYTLLGIKLCFDAYVRAYLIQCDRSLTIATDQPVSIEADKKDRGANKIVNTRTTKLIEVQCEKSNRIRVAQWHISCVAYGHGNAGPSVLGMTRPRPRACQNAWPCRDGSQCGNLDIILFTQST